MHDETRPYEAGSGSSGPEVSIPGLPACSCPKARAWDFLCQSEHVLSLLGELDEWLRRKTVSETSRQLSAAGSWKPRDSYAAIAKRRTEGSPLFPGRPTTKSGAQLRAEARASWAKVEREIAARPSWL